jgi:hypothetical protein
MDTHFSSTRKNSWVCAWTNNQLAKSFSTFLAMENFKQHAQSMKQECDVQFVDMSSNMTNSFVSL